MPIDQNYDPFFNTVDPALSLPGVPQAAQQEVSQDEFVVKVYRLKPVHAKGWYDTFDGEHLHGIEQKIKEKYGAGEYRIEVVRGPDILHNYTVSLAGGKALDTEGQEIPSADALAQAEFKVHTHSRGMALGDEAWGDKARPDHGMLERLSALSRINLDKDKRITELELELSRVRSDNEKARAEARQAEIESVKMKAQNESLRRELERVESSVSDRVRSAQSENKNPMMLMLMKHLLSKGETPQANGIGGLKESLSVIKDVKDIFGTPEREKDDDDESLMSFLKEAKGLIGAGAGLAPMLPGGQPLPQQAAPLPPPPPQVQGPVRYASEDFVDDLAGGLDDMPSPGEWAQAAVSKLTPIGSQALVQVNSIGDLGEWVKNGVPELDLEALGEILKTDGNRLNWLMESVRTMKGILING